MSDEKLEQIISYIDIAADQESIRRVVFSFHGGEPTLAKGERIRNFCDEARRRLESKMEVSFALQTNGVHLSDSWMKLISDERMGVGVSIDGEKHIHDLHRVDHKGNGSYDRVSRTLEKILPLSYAGQIRLTALAVMGPEFTGLKFYLHLVETLGIRNIKLLFQDRTADIPPSPEELEALGKMLIEIFDYWLLHDRDRVEVTLFDSAVRGIMSAQIRKRSLEDGVTVGLAVLSDGRVRIQDDYMVASEWFNQQEELFLSGSTFSDYMSQPNVREIVKETLGAPDECQSCAYVNSCAGGEIPHRHTRSRKFSNRSVYCTALKEFYEHVDSRINIGRIELARRAEVPVSADL